MAPQHEVACDEEEEAAAKAAKAAAGRPKRRAVSSRAQAPAMNEELVGKWLWYGFLDEAGNELSSFHGIIKQVVREKASFKHLGVKHQVNPNSNPSPLTLTLAVITTLPWP